MSIVEYEGRNAVVTADHIAFTFEVTDNPREFDSYRTQKDNLDWTRNDNFNYIGNWRIHSHGSANDLPTIIQKAVYENNSAPGLISKKIQLDWGKGPMLYEDKIVDGVPTKVWVEDKEITKWLESWDANDYILKQLTDFNHVEGSYTKFHKSRAGRVSRNRIGRLEHVMPNQGRLASSMDVAHRNKKPTHGIVTDYTLNGINALDYEVYPLFDHKNPFKYKTSIFYSNLYTFCSEYYSIPKLYGSLEWLRRSTAIPLILKALSKNSMNIKYHIQSPAEFWEKAEEALQSDCKEKGEIYNIKKLKAYKTAFLKKIANSLASDENTGKFIHTEKVFNRESTTLVESGWEITVLDQKIKDFVEAQLKIAKHADYALSANISIHSALGNVSESGKSDSGSEQLYALQNYLLTGVDIPEMIVLKPINYAIRANFPNSNKKIGFYHISPQREEDKSEKDRPKNKV